jgi:hypothetical protein
LLLAGERDDLKMEISDRSTAVRTRKMCCCCWLFC